MATWSSHVISLIIIKQNCTKSISTYYFIPTKIIHVLQNIA